MLQGQQGIVLRIDFNSYLPSPVPNTQGCFLEMTIIPDRLSILPNTPFTRFYGFQECLQNQSMVPYNETGAVTFSQDLINCFEHTQYCLAIRFHITFDIAEPSKPVLEARIIRRTQTDATALITTLDVVSMYGGRIPLHVLRYSNILIHMLICSYIKHNQHIISWQIKR